MTPSDFKRSLAGKTPPDGLRLPLVALWWAGKDDWHKAHEIVANGEGSDCAWVHAHLHRAEGDLSNARYWYQQARRPPASGDLTTEWTAMVAALLRLLQGRGVYNLINSYAFPRIELGQLAKGMG